ncbi:MAG: hydroxyacid dehydrogenase [Chloroflexi bacterium]|nr:hydroxyacid dehydrogenase [Chloroflexota bacterium]
MPIRQPLKVLQTTWPPPTDPSRTIEKLVTVPCRWSYVSPDDHEGLMRQLPGKDILVSAIVKADLARAATGLKAILLPAAGYEKIDPAAVPPGCIVANAYEHGAPIAEWVMMAAVVLDHEVIKADHTLRSNDWSMWIFRRPPYRELFGRTMGVIGLGHIGRRVLKLARAYDMRLIAVSRAAPAGPDEQSLGLAWSGDMSLLPRLLGESDFVVTSTPLTRDTRGLIGARELAVMKPSAYIINPARGPIIDEEALYHALKGRRIAGAAIDVWWQYPASPAQDATTPPSSFPFHELDNILMTPHISGGTYGTSARRARVVAANIDRLYRGEPLVNVVRDLSRPWGSPDAG